MDPGRTTGGGHVSTTSHAGRTAIVTGAGSGIGAALARRLRAGGAEVVTTDVAGDVDRRLDVRDLAGCRALVAEVGVPDLVFANAGVSMGGPTHELGRAHWDHVIDVNLNGVVNTVLAVYPGMVERGSGHVVATASGAGLVAPPFVTAYAATKHAVVGLALGLRPEAALHGVRVSVLCPGAVETPILDRLPDEQLPPTPTRPITAREYLSLLGQEPVDVDRFAHAALKAVERNRAIIAVPAQARALWYLHRLSPSLTDRITTAIARRVDRGLVQVERVGDA
ncbi:SDR family NAD(P)-dependent oxidoreductase [Salsipaludibacter albus]|uniref:SDR family NAD(P)-dependent oxidoreductase n=1 Tax=Salsipaludibacter albus TaxID=2849650 RepID=UPI003B75D1C0